MLKLADIRKSDNIIELFDELEDGETQLLKIGRSVVRGYQIDEDSRANWKKTVDQAMKIAKQVMEDKNFPWPKASNIKFPLICEAAIDFAARVGPEIIPNDKIVQCAVIGNEQYPPQNPRQQGASNDFILQGMKAKRANRISKFMSYQCLSSPDWKEGVDSLLQMLPVVGICFKKTYYSSLEKRIISEVCSPDDIVVNYNTKSLETARRITHKIKLSINDVIERQRKGLFNKDVEIDELRPEDCEADDDDFEITLLEQHCWWDLDGDDYKEPYIVIVHEQSGKVLRIVDRICEIEKEGKLISRITAEQYFTDFHFIRSMDGGFYSIGFGQLLLPINKGINSLFNQLIDAGTLSVTQGGLIGKGLRMRDGALRFDPFEWKVMDVAAGSVIKDNVYPFPVREPSATLYNLLTLMIQMGKDLTSSTEAVNGDLSGNNVSSQTMNTMVEQGSKIFNAIYKRTLLGMEKEYKKMYKLNYYYLPNQEYQNTLDDPEANVKADFELDSNDVRPVADPIFSTLSQRMGKIQVLMSLRTANPQAVDLYTLRTMQFDDEQIKQILAPPPPSPPPAKDQKDIAQAEQAKAQAQLFAIEAQKMMRGAPLSEAIDAKQLEVLDAQIQEGVARVWKMQKDANHGDQKILLAGGKMVKQEDLKAQIAENQKEKDTVDAIQKDKELGIKAAAVTTNAVLENKKIDVLKEKNNDPGNRSK